jgi:hypothetical protein
MMKINICPSLMIGNLFLPPKNMLIAKYISFVASCGRFWLFSLEQDAVSLMLQ